VTVGTRDWVDVVLHGRLTVLAWATGALLTAWILFGPVLDFAYLSPRGHLVLDTVDTCVALLAAYLAHGRFVRGARLGDLLLAQCLLLLGLANGLGGAVAALLPGAPGATEVWLPMMLRAAGAVLLLAAALAGSDRPSSASRRWSWAGPLMVVAAAVGVSWLVGPVLPIAVDATFIGDASHPPLLTGHPALIVGHLVGAACFLGASLLYTRRALQTGDELVRWLGAACALGGFARVNYALAPTVYTDWLYAGDLLRTGFYLLLLVGSVRELSLYWTARELRAVEEDRRRLARELHDGVVQELTYIRVEAHSIPDESLRDHVIHATDRALDEARTAIHALGHLRTEPLAEMLDRAARELARRHQLTVQVEADDRVVTDQHHQHTILRIVREAVTNAARHGRASTVRIELGQEDGGRVVRVCDDGSGFDPGSAARSSAGYGMISMAERARSLPGTLEIDSAVGRGSEVRVRW
jgi:signal transduction histidine kinase